MSDEDLALLKVKINWCFNELIDVLFVPGLHNRDAVQKASDFIHGVLTEVDDD